MSKIEKSFLCLHGHFSQPVRGNPLTGDIGPEPDAAPYDNWNDRITQTSYQPNAARGNFRAISFSFGESLLRWLETHAPDTYAAVISADKEAAQATPPAGTALATAYNHVILPLARRRDKRTQIQWGMATFEQRYGRKALGFWLPEMAVDIETLSLLAEAGIQYTLLASRQIRQPGPGNGGGPYRVQLPHDRSIAVFVRNDELSTQISFNIHNLGGAGRWSQQVLAPARKTAGSLLLLATSGETFGHHYAGEEEFLYWLTNHEAARVGFQVTPLDRYFVQHPPTQTVQIEELSSWGDHPLTYWAMGYADQYQDTTWKGSLRRALDNAASEVDRVYEELLTPHRIDPWTLRNHYVRVMLGLQPVDEFIAEYAGALTADQRQRLTTLLKTQELTQRMYNSYTFTDNRLDSPQARHAIASAAIALMMAQQATGLELSERFPQDLAVVRSGAVQGGDILRSVIEEYSLNS